MKHLLNNMTEEEKNAIREQHTGGMKVGSENFYKLLNSKLGDVKPLVKESMDASQLAKNAMAKANDPKNVSMKQSIIDCIKNNNYTHLMILTTGAGATALGALAALFVSGFGTVPALLISAAGAIMVGIEGYLTGKGSGSDSVGEELTKLHDCLKQSGKL